MDRHVSPSGIRLSGAVSVTPQGLSTAALAIHAGRIVGAPSVGAWQLELRDHLVFPGLINAHDHLPVNGVPPLRRGAPFPNSYAWIEAFQAHFDEPAVIAALEVPKALRMRHGALKNVLAGTTCVVHHDPWHAALDADDFPVAVPRGFGWSYTLSGPAYGPPVRESFMATPADRPWMIHLAEGTDAVAANELAELDRLGCLAANSVLIHGVGLTARDIDRVIASGAAVVWCPGSNRALLGRSLDPRRLYMAGRLAMGSDSRLSGARDLLDELRSAFARGDLPAAALLGLVTHDAARILRVAGHGHLQTGAVADMVIVEERGGEPAESLVGLRRAELRAVVRNGLPCIADPDFAGWFDAVGVPAEPVTLDGRPKLLASALADPALVDLEPGLVRGWCLH